MSPASIVSLALRILVLVGIGGCVTAIRRSASASERHLVWMLTLAATIALPAAAALLPTLGLITMPAVLANASVEVSSSQGVSLWPTLIAVTWLAGSLLCSISLLMAHARARRVVREASLNREWSHAIGLPVLLSIDAGFAFNYGVIAPVIVLPARATGWSDELLKATLIHEAAHVARGDAASLLISQLAQMIYWWHAAVRYIVREAASGRESACDDAVLRIGVSPSVYGEHLLANATPRLNDSVALAAPLFSRTDGLLRRIENLLDDGLDHGIVRRKVAYSAVAAALPLVALIASASPFVRGLPVESPKVPVSQTFAQAPRAAASPRAIDPVKKKRDSHAKGASSRRARNREARNPDTLSTVRPMVTPRDFASAASFPVDLKKFAGLAGAMGRMAGQMAKSVDSARLGVAR
jgi:beta-lactamase regulating signal transducer with metallopeptidase domain